MGVHQFSSFSTGNRDIFVFIATSRDGVDFDKFEILREDIPFDISDWTRILHISEHTIQRYKYEKERFDSIHMDGLLNILILLNKGIEVFGSAGNLNVGLNSNSISLGDVNPVSLPSSDFQLPTL